MSALVCPGLLKRVVWSAANQGCKERKNGMHENVSIHLRPCRVTSWSTRGRAFSRADGAVHTFATAAVSTQAFSILLAHLLEIKAQHVHAVSPRSRGYNLRVLHALGEKRIRCILRTSESPPSSAAHSGRWRWTSPAGSWRWWTGRPWPPCSRWRTSDQTPRSGPADIARQWPRSPTIWNVKEQPS